MSYGWAATVILLLFTASQYIMIRMENTQLRKQLGDQQKSKIENDKLVEGSLSQATNKLTACKESLKASEDKLAADTAQIQQKVQEIVGRDEKVNSLKTENANAEARENNLKGEVEKLTNEKGGLANSLKECEGRLAAKRTGANQNNERGVETRQVQNAQLSDVNEEAVKIEPASMKAKNEGKVQNDADQEMGDEKTNDDQHGNGGEVF